VAARAQRPTAYFGPTKHALKSQGDWGACTKSRKCPLVPLSICDSHWRARLQLQFSGYFVFCFSRVFVCALFPGYSALVHCCYAYLLVLSFLFFSRSFIFVALSCERVLCEPFPWEYCPFICPFISRSSARLFLRVCPTPAPPLGICRFHPHMSLLRVRRCHLFVVAVYLPPCVAC
jgi:hypothetical protein